MAGLNLSNRKIYLRGESLISVNIGAYLACVPGAGRKYGRLTEYSKITLEE